MQARALLVTCFFFQAEDGIRDADVTGVQTCALPICGPAAGGPPVRVGRQRPARPARYASTRPAGSPDRAGPAPTGPRLRRAAPPACHPGPPRRLRPRHPRLAVLAAGTAPVAPAAAGRSREPVTRPGYPGVVVAAITSSRAAREAARSAMAASGIETGSYELRARRGVRRRALRETRAPGCPTAPGVRARPARRRSGRR